MTSKKKGGRNAVRSRTRKPPQLPVAQEGPSESAEPVATQDQPAALEDNRPVRVVQDPNTPGGFRMEPV